MSYLVVYHCNAHDWTTAQVIACYETYAPYEYMASAKRLIPRAWDEAAGRQGVEMGCNETEWVAMRYQDTPMEVGSWVEHFEDDQDSDLIGDWKIA